MTKRPLMKVLILAVLAIGENSHTVSAYANPSYLIGACSCSQGGLNNQCTGTTPWLLILPRNSSNRLKCVANLSDCTLVTCLQTLENANFFPVGQCMCALRNGSWVSTGSPTSTYTTAQDCFTATAANSDCLATSTSGAPAKSPAASPPPPQKPEMKQKK